MDLLELFAVEVVVFALVVAVDPEQVVVAVLVGALVWVAVFVDPTTKKSGKSLVN